MAILPVLICPDPRLRNQAETVTQFDDELAKIVADMLDTLAVEGGGGLAAIQVDIKKRIVVIDKHAAGINEHMVLINPEIIARSGVQESKEGCYSIPGVLISVQRAAKATVRAQNLQGDFFETSGEGWLAACFQHEIDHLNGVLSIDYISSSLKRELVLEKVRKAAKQKNK